jgi:hypothetical protein
MLIMRNSPYLISSHVLTSHKRREYALIYLAMDTNILSVCTKFNPPASFLQVTAPAVGGHYTRVPQMGQRSPRLVFRDPDIPGTIHASSPYYSQQAANSLQDLATDDPRGEA